jgi:hypothetical protein
MPVRVSALEPRIHRRDILPGIPGDPGKRPVEVPAGALAVYQNETVRHFTKDREVDDLLSRAR